MVTSHVQILPVYGVKSHINTTILWQYNQIQILPFYGNNSHTSTTILW